MPSAKIFDRSTNNTNTSSLSVSAYSPTFVKASVSKKSSDTNEEFTFLDQQKIDELLAERDALEDQILAKLEELKDVCLQEAEMTGILPVEIFMTLHPDEPAPKVKRRVGTTFTIPDDVLDNANTDDKVTLMETDIAMQKEIIAATERMSKDKFINKSIRKKHRRDLQNAHHKLRHLQKGLTKMRISLSKPDVSSLDGLAHSSGISLRREWMSKEKAAKSCPTTPRGSVPDLCDSDEQSSNCSHVWSKPPMLSGPGGSLLQLNSGNKTSGSSIVTNTSSPNDSGCHSGSGESSPPALPYRQPPVHADRLFPLPLDFSDSPVYENIGYTSVVPYKSAYRQSNFPTFLASSEHRLRREDENSSNDHAATLTSSVSAQFPQILENPSNFGTKSLSMSQFGTQLNYPSSQQNLALAANTQLGRILRKMGNTSLAGPSNRLSGNNPSVVRSAQLLNNTDSFTSSLDRRSLRQKQNDSGHCSMTPTNATTLTTTFPVVNDMNSVETSRSRSLSQRNGIGISVPHCTVNPRSTASTSKLGSNCWPAFNANRDPQMENLLSFYRNGAVGQQYRAPAGTPNTRVVPIKKQNPSTSNATMV